VKYVKISILLLTIGILSYGVFSIPKFIKIGKVSCHSQFGNCNHEISSRLQNVIGGDYYSTKNRIEQILSSIMLVEKYSVQFKLPNILVVDILERKPKYALSSANQEWLALTDKEGVVLGLSDSTNLPTVRVLGYLPNPGDVVDDEILFASKIVYGTSLQHSVLTAEMGESKLRVALTNGRSIIFPLEGDVELLLGSLNIIIGRLNSSQEESKIEKVSEIKIIDLRFKNPVLK
jgi:cell division septal protein FtsQ